MAQTKVDLDWSQLGFQFLPTHAFMQADFADGAWGPLQQKTEPYLPLHIAANCLHYGQAAFEGLKAFTTRDGRVVMFRPEMNARRMQASADRLCMACPPEETFVTACAQAVQANLDFVPPYGSGASLYIRPLLVGTEPTVGIKPSTTYTFVVLVTPVGPYYKNGFFPVRALVMEGFDRAAPLGTGKAKVAGNYAASLLPDKIAHDKGFPIVLYSDPRENKYVDEFGTSNFIGITRDGVYRTPDSLSTLPSITNDSLRVLAQDLGMPVDQSPIPLTELDQFCEVGSCGTAAVITPVGAIHWGERVFTFGQPNQAGETLTKLYKMLQGVQYGELPDTHGWLVEVK